MPTSVGPNTFGEENLVFAFDTGDTVNSYKGRPTTNRLSQLGVDGFDLTVASTWGGGDSSFITYDSTVVTPYGNTGATKITALSGSNNHHLFSKNSWSEGSELGYTMQALIKPIQLTTRVTFGLYNDGSSRIGFDLNSNTIYYGTGISNRTAKIRYVEDGWYYLEANVEGRSGGWVPSFGIGDENGNPINWTPTEDQSIYVAAVQFEPGQSVASPFVNGTRSATEGLKDLTGNSTIDLTNVSFDSNAQMTFDGSNDYGTISDATLFDFGTTNFSIEAVVQGTDTSNYRTVFYHYYNPGITYITMITTGVMRVWIGGTVLNGNTNILDGNYHHTALVRQGDILSLYVDGELDASSTGWASKSATNTSKGASIGRYIDGSSAYPWNGEVASVKAYSRALTASEIKSNFNAIKGRFNI